MASKEELRQILKEDSAGKSAYDHLVEVLMKIALERPQNLLDNFELISASVKANPLNPDPEMGRPVPPSAEELELMNLYVKRCAAQLKVPDEPPEDSGVKFPDLVDEFNLLEWAGVSFGKAEVYRLYLSIKKLAETLPGETERLRFFGKITTRGLPYYIVEGVNPEEEEGIDETKQETKAGANKYAYWVTQNIESQQWTKLPNVTMAQVVAARQFKRFFKGDLEAEVPSYPPFNGREKHFLRTQIARIVGETSISPDGFYTLDESDPPVVVPAEAEAMNEAFPKPASDLKDPEAWKHHEIELNKLGRVTAMPEQLDENGEPIEPEEPVEVVGPLEAIKPEQWSFRLAPGGAGAAASSVVMVRSLAWPGAIAVCAGRRYLNVYVGNGIAYTATTYTPPMPAPIQQEWAPPADDESQAAGLIEQPDVRIDPTPPAPEGAADDE